MTINIGNVYDKLSHEKNRRQKINITVIILFQKIYL